LNHPQDAASPGPHTLCAAADAADRETSRGGGLRAWSAPRAAASQTCIARVSAPWRSHGGRALGGSRPARTCQQASPTCTSKQSPPSSTPGSALEHVAKGVVERGRGHAHHVRLAHVHHHAAPLQPLEDRPHRPAEQHCARERVCVWQCVQAWRSSLAVGTRLQDATATTLATTHGKAGSRGGQAGVV
jgi:hypothetical protein